MSRGLMAKKRRATRRAVGPLRRLCRRIPKGGYGNVPYRSVYGISIKVQYLLSVAITSAKVWNVTGFNKYPATLS